MSQTRHYQARPTTYSDILFRSALEARWAAFFDHIGWEWMYEPDGPRGYIPDFLILGEQRFYLEVKPVYTTQEAKDLIRSELIPKMRGWQAMADLVVVGLTPFLDEREIHCEDGHARHLFAGAVSAGGNLTLQGDELFWFKEGARTGLANRREKLVTMPCPSSAEFFPSADTRDVAKCWSHATNATRWNP